MKEKAQTSDFYHNAIETWTIRDVKKRNFAKEHNLNWVEFFNLKFKRNPLSFRWRMNFENSNLLLCLW